MPKAPHRRASYHRASYHRASYHRASPRRTSNRRSAADPASLTSLHKPVGISDPAAGLPRPEVRVLAVRGDELGVRAILDNLAFP